MSKSASNWAFTDMHHLGLTVGDLERSIRFYQDTLGMELERRRPNVDADYVAKQTGYPGVVLDVASFRVSPTCKQTLEIVQYMRHAGTPNEPGTNRAGVSHLCLLVDDLRASHKDLLSKGVKFRSEPVEITAGPNQGGLVIYFYDPDGYTIEMFQPPKR